VRITKLKIGQRLFIGFGAVIMTTILVILFGVAKLTSLKRDIGVMANERYPLTALANSMKSDLYDVVQAMRDIVLLTDTEEIKIRLTEVEQSTQFAATSLSELTAKRTLSDKEDALKRGVKDAFEDFGVELGEFRKLVEAGQPEQARDALYTRAEAARLALFQALNALVAYQSAEMASSSNNAAHEAERAVPVMLALAAGAGLLAILIGLFVTRSITQPLGDAAHLAKRVAAGDLTASIDTQREDETGALVNSLKEMNHNLGYIVADVRSGSDAIVMASAEIARGNLELAARTEEQTASVERIVASMGDLTDMVTSNADNARNASEVANAASTVANEGGAIMKQVVETMQSIDESARKVADIISLIDGLAFQTNILALNAAVEAARAGAQGRGFAVVASEVRTLAHRSACAAKEIKELIDDSVSRAMAGNRLVAQARGTMDEVVSSVRQVTDIIGEISTASHKQSAEIVNVNNAFTMIDKAASQNAALVEEAAAAAGRMREEANTLQRTVGMFTLKSPAPANWTTIAAAPDDNTEQAGKSGLALTMEDASVG